MNLFLLGVVLGAMLGFWLQWKLMPEEHKLEAAHQRNIAEGLRQWDEFEQQRRLKPNPDPDATAHEDDTRWDT